MAGDTDDWTLLMKCSGQPQAQVVRGRLEAEGIGVELEDESSNSLMMFLGSSSEIRVFVPARSLEQAQALLLGDDDDDGRDPEERDPDELEPPDEPKLRLGAVFGLAIVGMTLGLGQIYVGRRTLGLVMLATAALSFYLWIAFDNAWAGGAVIEIWAADLLLASWTIILRNREIDARKQARIARRPLDA